MSERDFVRYVVVVHGMGEARKNETILAVASRFAEARAQDRWPPPDDVLTLGMASSQAGQPWVELEGIPLDPARPTTAPFLGKRSSVPATNLRFVDVHWAKLLSKAFPRVGQDPNTWADGVLGRLVRKDEDARREGRTRVPFWAIRILELLREAIALSHGYARLRAEALDDLVFTKYLGDVQLYGEFAPIRGRAVRAFHDLIGEVEAKHEGPREARYTVIAHSLGTVMAMDALLFAHAKRAVREGQEPSVNLPFPGYANAGDAVPDTSWVQRVDSFVTLGSPIDKFLFLWWLNYEYLLDERPWLDERLLRPGARIEHFNFAEEQDPVGHELDLARTAPAFARIFDTKEDRVYVRCALPAVAHVQYWKDLDLFRFILERVVDRREDARPPRWFDLALFRKVLAITYEVIPYGVVALSFGAFTWAWYSGSWHNTALMTLLLFAVNLLGRRLLDLTLWWRQVLRAKQSQVLKSNVTGKDAVADVRTLAQSFVSSRPPGEEELRKREEARYRGWLIVTMCLWLVAAGVSGGSYLLLAVQHGWWAGAQWGRLLLIGAVLAAANWAWAQLFESPNVA